MIILYQYHTLQRKLQGEARFFVLSLLAVGSNPTSVQIELKKSYGFMLKAKDLLNIKQGLSG